MSIKSQKSLNEECSEIFEKSYSVRSLSDESLSTEDEETDSLCRELLRKMSPAALTQLRRRFKRGRQVQHNVNRKVEEAMVAAALQEGVEFATSDPPAAPTDALWLDEDSFVAAIDEIFGGHKYSAHARQLCVALDPLRSGRVHWSALLARLLPAPRPPRAPALAHKPSRLPHAQRECIVKLVSLHVGDRFCYVCVTRGGRVGVYSGDLQLLNTYEVNVQAGSSVPAQNDRAGSRQELLGDRCSLHER
ncbi:uncharacterized protein LOC123722405 [Papilio machaon]|uniref:uncharacterized protein LOC123722405 n=1 Tax=Papilio machaon TaxID=76193 RepID=UPI001E6641E3|nr:uncharacterized protein LOC123722405 [Papilio machaon]